MELTSNIPLVFAPAANLPQSPGSEIITCHQVTFHISYAMCSLLESAHRSQFSCFLSVVCLFVCLPLPLLHSPIPQSLPLPLLCLECSLRGILRQGLRKVSILPSFFSPFHAATASPTEEISSPGTHTHTHKMLLEMAPISNPRLLTIPTRATSEACCSFKVSVILQSTDELSG